MASSLLSDPHANMLVGEENMHLNLQNTHEQNHFRKQKYKNELANNLGNCVFNCSGQCGIGRLARPTCARPNDGRWRSGKRTSFGNIAVR